MTENIKTKTDGLSNGKTNLFGAVVVLPLLYLSVHILFAFAVDKQKLVAFFPNANG